MLSGWYYATNNKMLYLKSSVSPVAPFSIGKFPCWVVQKKLSARRTVSVYITKAFANLVQKTQKQLSLVILGPILIIEE